MSSQYDDTGEEFRLLLLRLRGRISLNQRQLAAQMGVHVHSIQGWESGANYPGEASLRALIAAAVRAGGFTVGREEQEAAALWSAALREAPRIRTRFDRAWFHEIAAGHRGAAQSGGMGAAHGVGTPAGESRRESWGEAPDVAGFLGRTAERELLAEWILDERCRTVGIFGLGGIGKTLLTARAARDVAPAFDRIYWRSLLNAPTPGDWLAQAFRQLAPEVAPTAGSESAQFRQLLRLLNETRSLLVMDNFETVLEPGSLTVRYRDGFQGYGRLVQQLGESPHRSCLIVTSRETPPELRALPGDERGPVRARLLGGFATAEGRALLDDKELAGDDDAWQSLVARYGGNGLALKVVGETIRELFGGAISEYLDLAATTPSVAVGSIHALLDAQIRRLSDAERDVLRWLAIEREPVSLVDAEADLSGRLSRSVILEAMDGLRRRSLLERTHGRSGFALQPNVMEFVTGQLVDEVAQELTAAHPTLLCAVPLVKATARDYVRGSQEQLLALPVVESLVQTTGSREAAERLLLALLSRWRDQSPEEHGYGPGNVANLLRLLRGNLRNVDLSRLTIRQAYLPEAEAQEASLAGSHLRETVLAEAFRYPTSLALSADGAYLAAGTASGEVCQWRVVDRTLVTTLPGHAGTIRGVALSGDGRLVVSGGIDGTVRLWDATSERSLATLHGHTGGVRGVALSGDARLAASSGLDGTVRLWEVEGRQWQSRATLHGHTGEVYSVALSEDGRLVASGGLDGTVRLWETEGGRALATLTGHTGAVRGVALSRDGRVVASGSLDDTVRLWDTGSGRLLATLRGHTIGVYSVALSGDGRLVASGGADDTVRLWETESGRLVAALPGRSGLILGVAMSGDGGLVAVGGVDGTVYLWAAENGLLMTALHGHAGVVMCAALSGDGRLAASGSHDGTVQIWDAESGRLQATLKGHAGHVTGVAVSRDGRLIVSSGIDESIRLWDVASGRLLTTLREHTGAVRGVALSEDGRLVASGGTDATVRLWDPAMGRPLVTLSGHTGEVASVALSRDGRLVASGSLDGTVRLWETASGRLLTTLHEHIGGVLSVALSGDGRLVASGSYDGDVRIWDGASGQPLAVLQGHTGGVWSVALSDDGGQVASAGHDGTVRLWDAESGELLAALHGHVGLVMGVGLRGDGGLVASGGVDGTVRLWDMGSGDISSSALQRVLRRERRYEGLDITGLTGVTNAQRRALLALGAIEQPSR